MCAVSAITDHYRDKWPTPDYSHPYQGGSHVNISKQEWEEYQKLKRVMEEYDKKTKQPDCVKPEVAIWESLIEKVLREKGIIK